MLLIYMYSNNYSHKLDIYNVQNVQWTELNRALIVLGS